MSKLEIVTQIRTVGQGELDRLASSVGVVQAKVDALAQSEARLAGLLGQVAEGLRNVAAGHSQAAAAQEQAASSGGRAAQSFMAQMVQANLLTGALSKLASVVKTFTVDAALYAARTETVSVVLGQLAKVNGLSESAVRRQVEAVKALGITTQDAISVINRMIFAQLDLKKATELARLAQNAGVIAGINTSEALQGIIHGIVTRQPEVLRTYGITVDFERRYAEVARERGRQLTNVEKTEVALQEVLKQGTRIQGAYEASMMTVGKQLTSLTRYIDEAKNAIGQAFVPVLGNAVTLMTHLAKYATENAEGFANLARHITAAGAALAAIKWVPGGPIPKLIAGAAAFVGAEFLLGGDPVENAASQGRAAMNNLLAERERIKARLAANRYGSPEERKADLEALQGWKERAEAVANQVAFRAAEALVRKYKDVMFEAQRVAADIDLGGGIKVTRGQVLQAIQAIKNPEPGGATVNQALIDEENRRAVELQRAQEFAEKAKAAKEKLDGIMVQLAGQTGGEFARFVAWVDDFEKDVAPYLRGDPRLAQARAMMQQRRDELMEKTLREARAEYYAPAAGRRQWEMLRYLMPVPTGVYWDSRKYQAQMVSVDERAADRAYQGGISGAVDRVLAARQRYTDFQARMAELAAGPGGEIAAANRVYELRIAAAQREYAVRRDLAAFEAAVDQARYDRQIRIAELQRRQLQEYKEAAGRVFDALVQSGRTGLRDLLRGQALTVARVVFQNAAGMAMRSVNLGLPGVSPDSTLGKLLAGTPFDPARRQDVAAQQQLTAAQLQLQAAQMQLQAAGVSTGAAATAAAAAGVPAVAGGGGSASGGGGISGAVGRWLGFGGALSGAVLGGVAGIRQGGVGGALSAAGSILGGGMMALSMVSKSLAFLGPWGAIAGMGLGLLGSLFGRSKQERAEEIRRMIDQHQKTWAEGRETSEDLWGRGYDLDASGRTRVIVQQNITVPVKAFDAKDVYDARAEIADAIAGAAREGHPFVPQLRARLAF